MDTAFSKPIYILYTDSYLLFQAEGIHLWLEIAHKLIHIVDEYNGQGHEGHIWHLCQSLQYTKQFCFNIQQLLHDIWSE